MNCCTNWREARMPVILCFALIAAVTTSVLARRHRQMRRARSNPIARAFRGREFRQFDAYLETVAREELRRMDEDLARYLAGSAGYVVVVSRAPNGIELELSDGRRLALRGISSHTVELLNRRAPVDMLRPETLDRDALSCRLLLRGQAGAELKVFARMIALAA
jgi:hypothetical protein